MSVFAILAKAGAQGVDLRVIGHDLTARWQCNDPPPPDLIADLKAHKQAIIDALGAANRFYEFEERAAIMEFGAGMSRNEAEAAAREALGYDG